MSGAVGARFCVLYRFRVRAGEGETFTAAWARVTEAILEHCGGLGSRLHRGAGDGEYFAYAQWPSRERWQAADLPDGVATEERALLRGVCEEIETLLELDVVEDRLR